MKKLISVMVCLTFIACSYAQKPKADVPVAAKTAFAAKYPTAQKVKWSVEKPGEFEVEFTLGKVESSALFDTSGKFLESEIEIKQSELPQMAKTVISKDFAGFKIDEIEKSTDSKGNTSYEMEAAKGKEKLELVFDVAGKLLSQKPVEEKEKEDK